MNLLEQFSNNKHKYTKNEEILFEQVFDNIDRVINHNISVFSNQIGTSTASLSRFIKKNGFENYNQFRLECLKYKNSALNDTELIESKDFVENYMDRYSSFMEIITQSFKTEDIKKLSEIINKFDRIRIYGSHRSRLVAEKISMELLSLGKYVEIVTAEILLNNVEIFNQQTDCIIFISESLKSSTINYLLENPSSLEMHKVFISMRMHNVAEKDDVTFVKLPNVNDYPQYSFLDNSIVYMLFINMLLNLYSKEYKQKGLL